MTTTQLSAPKTTLSGGTRTQGPAAKKAWIVFYSDIAELQKP